MSDNIDNRIISMQFENEDFEKKAAQSTKTLENLEKQLDMTESIDNTDKALIALDKADFSTLVESVSKLTERFSFFGEIGRDVLNTVTASARSLLNAVSQTIDSMSIMAGMQSGWGKYNEYITSTQTIQSALPDMDISEIEDRLSKLMWYTDETSYKFTDMVNSIGKFTSAGMDLDGSITAMEGIANWAASAGVNANEATRAFYNISQAIGAGAMKTIDWKSIEMLNMGTREFKQQAIEAALAVGTLTQKTDGIYGKNAYGKMEKLADSVDDLSTKFRETLSGGWFDTNVMMKVFGTYGEYADKLYDLMQTYPDKYDTANDAMADLAEDGMEIAAKAFKAAQVAKTFEDAIDSVRDAVSSKWLETWKLLFGNLTEASSLWTDLANNLWEIFAGGGDARNDILRQWHNGLVLLIDDFPELGKEMEKIEKKFQETGFAETILPSTVTLSGYELMVETLDRTMNFLLKTIEAVKLAIGQLIPAPTAEQLIMFSYRINEWSKALDDKLLVTVKRIHNVILSIGKIVKAVFGPIIETSFNILKRIFGEITGIIGDMADGFVISDDALERFGKIGKGTARILNSLVKVGESIVYIFSPIGKIFVSLADLFLTITSSIFELVGGMSEAATESEGFSSTVEVLHSVISKFSEIVSKIIDKLNEGFKKLDPLIGPVVDKLKEFSQIFAEWAKPYYDKFIDWLESFDIDFSKLKDTFVNAGPKISETATTVWNALKRAWGGIKKIWDFAQPYLEKVWSWVKEKAENISFDALTEKLDTLVYNWNTYILPTLKEVWSFLKSVGIGIWEELKETFGSMTFGEKLDAAEGAAKILLIVEAIKTLAKGNGLIGAITEFFTNLSTAIAPVHTVSEDILQIGIGLLTMSLGLILLTKIPIEKLQALPDWLGYLTGSLIAVVLILNKIPTKRKNKTALTLVALALAVGKIVKSIIDLAEAADGENGIKKIETAGMIVDAMIACLGVASLLSGLGTPKLGSLIGYYAMVGAIKLLTNVIVNFSDAIGAQGVDKIQQASEIVSALMVILGIVSGPFSKLVDSTSGLISNIGGFVKDIGSAALMLAGSIVVAEIALVAMMKISDAYTPEQINAAIGTIGVLAIGLAVVTAIFAGLLSLTGQVEWGSSVALIAMAAATWVIVKTMTPLIGIPFEQLISVAGSMAVLMLALGGAVALMGTVKKMKIGAIIALVVVVIAMRVLTKAMIKLANMEFDDKKLLNMCLGMAVVMASIAAVIWAMGSVNKMGLGKILALILVIGMLAEVAAILFIFDKYGSGKWDSILAAAVGMLIVIDFAVIPLLVALSKIQKVKFGSIVVAIEAIGIIAAVGAALALITATGANWDAILAAAAGMLVVIDVAVLPLLMVLQSISGVKFGSLIVTIEAIGIIVSIGYAMQEILSASQNADAILAATIALLAVIDAAVLPLLMVLQSISGVNFGSIVVTIEAIAIIVSIGYAMQEILSACQNTDAILAATIALIAVIDGGVLPLIIVVEMMSESFVTALASMLVLISVAGVIVSVGWALSEIGTLPQDQLVAATIALDSIILLLTLLTAVAGFAGIGGGIALAALAGVILSIGAAVLMIAEAVTIFEEALYQSVMRLPEKQASINKFLLELISGIDAALHLLWENIKNWAIQVAHDIPYLGIAIFAAFLEGCADGLSYLGTVLDKIIPGISQWISDAWNTLIQFGKDLWNGIKEGIIGALSSQSWGEVWGKIKTGFADFFDINSPAKEMIPLGAAVAEGVAVGIKQGIPMGEEAAKDLSYESQKAYQRATGSGQNSAWTQSGYQAITDYKSGAESAIPDVDEMLAKAGEHNYETLTLPVTSGKYQAGGMDMMTSFMSGIDTGSMDLTAGLEGIGGDILGSFSSSLGIGSMDGLFSIGSSGIGDLINGFGSGEGDLTAKIESIVSSIKNTLNTGLGGTSSLGEIYKIGMNAIQGFINGMASKTSAAYQKAKEIANGVLKTMKVTLNEHSPSKATAEMGEFLMIGLANGMDDSYKQAVDSATHASDETVNAMGKSLEGLWTVSEFDDIDNEIHFTVVVDNQEAMAQLEAMKSGMGYARMLSGTKFAAKSIDLATRTQNEFQQIGKPVSANQNVESESDSEDKFVFNQYNYSPKSLSRLDIYRDTRKQLLEFKRSGK